MSTNGPPPRDRAAALRALGWVLVFSLIWSSAFIAGKIGVRHTDPFTLLVLRFALAAALLGAHCVHARRKHPFGQRALIRDGLVLGLLNNAAYLGLSFSALQYISADLVVIVVSCTPFFTAALAGALGMERIGTQRWLGMLAGFAGVLIITLARPVGSVSLIGLALAMTGTLSFAAATLFYRSRSGRHDPQIVNFWQSLIAAVALLPLAARHGFGFTPDAGLALWGSVLYLALAVSIGGMWIWLHLIRRLGASAAASCHLANPACALLLSALVLGTTVQASDLLGIAIIMGGLGLANGRRIPERPGETT